MQKEIRNIDKSESPPLPAAAAQIKKDEWTKKERKKETIKVGWDDFESTERFNHFRMIIKPRSVPR